MNIPSLNNIPWFKGLVLGGLLALGGCAGLPLEEAEQTRQTPPAPLPKPAPQVSKGVEVKAYPKPTLPAYARPQPSKAVLALESRAAHQMSQGDWNGAVASLERALRIEPRNPRLWNRLAQVRLQQGQTRLAASLAARSNALPGVDQALRQDNQRIQAAAQTD